MAFTGSSAITVNGGSATTVFTASGTIDLSPFTSFSAFLTDTFTATPTGYNETDSGSLTLTSPFSSLVATNVDTISAGADTVVSGSVSINYIFGGATTPLFSSPYSETLGGASADLSKVLAAAASNMTLGGASSELKLLNANELLKPATSATVPAAAHTVQPTLAASTGTQIDLGDAKATLLPMAKHIDKA